jgi:photosystem II stability/assembly factor-like uncharacterized protein
MPHRRCHWLLVFPTLAVLATLALSTRTLAGGDAVDARRVESLLEAFTFRNLGPFRAGAWISAIAVPEAPERAHLYTFYVGARTGGVWKTTNNGTTFEPIFEGQPVSAIGALAVAPSNPDIVWVGTGDANSARSSYSGDGVYKSTDGGRTWRHMGLADSHHIASIRIHPRNPDIVYVAAMGHLFSRNEERGLFKTTDGGRTWTKVLYVNDRTGVIDLVMHPRDPDTLYAATYEKERRPWHFDPGGPGSGIHKTTDGGRTWRRLTAGLPQGKIGRIGLDIYRRNPSILYAVVENANERPPTEEEAKQDRERGVAPAPRAIGNQVFRSDDGGLTWRQMSRDADEVGSKAAYSFNKIRIDPSNDQRIFVTSDALVTSEDGGRTWSGLTWRTRKAFPRMFGDVRDIWIDPRNPDRILLGTDGGVQVSYDGGRTSDYYHNLPLGEVYAVAVDMEDPYRIYAGLQDHEHWRGPVNSWSGRVTIEDWVTVGTQDGMYVQVDPADSRWVYTTYQFGGHRRLDQQRMEQTNIEPTRAAGAPPLRFNWTPPLVISPHNPRILYTGAQVLLRSLDRGDHWQEISPDLTTNDEARIALTGPSIRFCTITTISESPVTPGILWVGTDDGKVQVTRDGGATWVDRTGALAAAGAPADLWVSRVFASPHEAGTAFVAKTGFRADDFRPFLFKTTDFGATWAPLAAGLPDRPVNVVWQDRRNAALLFAGTDGGVYVSLDGGSAWARMPGVPRVPVHDLLVHPREQDLVVGTYGRGLFVADVTVLQELTPAVLSAEAHLFGVEPKPQRRMRALGNYHLYGDRYLETPNEPVALVLTYLLREAQSEKARIRVRDLEGREVRTLEGPAAAGLNRVLWHMDDDKERPVPAGEYVISVEVAGRTLVQRARVL